jgi:transposase
MGASGEERRVWDSIRKREKTRQENIEELEKTIKEVGASGKNPKSLFKLVLYAHGIKTMEAADIIGVKMSVIEKWTGQLKDKNLVEVEGESHPNPTIKPTQEVLEKFRKAQEKNKALMKERRMRSKLEDEVEEKEHMLEEIESRLEREKKMRAKLEEKLKLEEDELKVEEGEFLEKAASDMLVEVLAEHPGQDLTLYGSSAYLMFEEEPRRSVGFYMREIKNGVRGLYITRSNPKQVKRRYDLGDSEVCWLTGVKSTDKTPSVSGLQELSILVSKFIDENQNGVILIDGLEYLISNNDFQVVLRLIQQMRDKVSTSEAKMFIPVNPNALEPKQRTLLERECQTIK